MGICQTNRKYSKKEIISDFAKSTHRSSGAHEHESYEIAEYRKDSFVFSINGLSTIEAQKRLERFGFNELGETKTAKWYLYASQFWKPMAIMIWIAAIVEAGIKNYPDMAILFGILLINSSIAYYETVKAGDAIAALKNTLKPRAIAKRNDKFISINASCLVPGDLILLASGSAVPADCRVNEGEIEVDEAALTGESLPATKYKGDSCKLGSTVVRGEVKATVEATGQHTFVGRTAALLVSTHTNIPTL